MFRRKEGQRQEMNAVSNDGGAVLSFLNFQTN